MSEEQTEVLLSLAKALEEEASAALARAEACMSLVRCLSGAHINLTPLAEDTTPEDGEELGDGRDED